MIETINKLVRTSRQMLHEIGREPAPEELAEKLGMPLEKVRKVLKIAKEPISLETPIGDEEDSHLGDFIEDKARGHPARRRDPGQSARGHHPRAVQPDAARGTRAAHALRHRHEHRPHAGRGRPAVQRHPRAHPPDRGQGAAQAEAPAAAAANCAASSTTEDVDHTLGESARWNCGRPRRRGGDVPADGPAAGRAGAGAAAGHARCWPEPYCAVATYRHLYNTVGAPYVWWLRRTDAGPATGGAAAQPGGVDPHPARGRRPRSPASTNWMRRPGRRSTSAISA